MSEPGASENINTSTASTKSQRQQQKKQLKKLMAKHGEKKALLEIGIDDPQVQDQFLSTVRNKNMDLDILYDFLRSKAVDEKKEESPTQAPVSVDTPPPQDTAPEKKQRKSIQELVPIDEGELKENENKSTIQHPFERKEPPRMLPKYDPAEEKKKNPLAAYKEKMLKFRYQRSGKINMAKTAMQTTPSQEEQTQNKKSLKQKRKLIKKQGLTTALDNWGIKDPSIKQLIESSIKSGKISNVSEMAKAIEHCVTKEEKAPSPP